MKLLHFTADWCQPCKNIKPIIEEYVAENSSIEYIQIDVDSNIEITKNHSIMSIPTLVIINNEKEVARHNGIITKDQLSNLFLVLIQ
jgi:thioredoxin 1